MPSSSNASTARPTVEANGSILPMRVKESDVVSLYPASVVSVIPDPDDSNDDDRTIVHACEAGHTLGLSAPPSEDPDEIRIPPRIIFSSGPQKVLDDVSIYCTDASGKRTTFPKPANGHLEYDPSYVCRETNNPDDPKETITVDVRAIPAGATVNCRPSVTGGAFTLPVGFETRLEGGRFKPNRKAVQWVEGDDRSRTIFN
jgi:hypothetical protein